MKKILIITIILTITAIIYPAVSTSTHSSVKIATFPEFSVLYIPAKTRIANIKDVIGKAYKEIFAYLKASNVNMSQNFDPYVKYNNKDMNNLDIEIGVRVKKALPGNDKIKSGKIAAGKYAVIMHTGPYNEIGKTYEIIMAYIKKNKLKTKSFCYELYLNDPKKTPANKLETIIYLPIES